jgi:hypothetical protein
MSVRCGGWNEPAICSPLVTVRGVTVRDTRYKIQDSTAGIQEEV